MKDDCDHDYGNPVRMGRADYRCRLCGESVTLALALTAELEMTD